MKRLIVLSLAVILSLSLTGCFGGRCANCGTPIGKNDREYDPIAGKYVCQDCFFSNAWDILDRLMYVDMIGDYLDAHGYAMIEK